MEWYHRIRQDPATCDACGGKINRLRGMVPGSFHTTDPVANYAIPPFIYCSGDCRDLWEIEDSTVSLRAEEARRQTERDEAWVAKEAIDEARRKRARSFSVGFDEPTVESFQTALQKILHQQVEAGDFDVPGLHAQKKQGLRIVVQPTKGADSILALYFWGEEQQRAVTREFAVRPITQFASQEEATRWSWKDRLHLLEFRLTELDLRRPRLPYRHTMFGSRFE